MKKISITQFRKKAKVINTKDQKKIKGGFKQYDRPYSIVQNDWIEIDIRREAPTPNHTGKGNLSSIHFPV